MIPRSIEKQVLKALSRQAAVALIGPRQSGKTTLALAIAEQREAVYLDLEDAGDRSRLSDPALFLEPMADRLVILDEIHRVPELFQPLRGIIDRGRRMGKGSGRFLILGSASIDLLRQSGESLAGRVSYLELTPFSTLEVEGRTLQLASEQHSADDQGTKDRTSSRLRSSQDRAVRERLWLRGGFPDSYLAEDDESSLAWRKDFIRTYLERDVATFGPRIPAATLERLWTMLAHRQGTLLNAAALAKALEVSAQSVTRYIDLLADLLLARRLPPLHANVGKRLVKSPKVYVRDSGLVHALLGIPSLTALAGHPVVGNSWEGFVIETLLTVLPWRASAFFYRTSAGAEIDLVVEQASGERWAIEIKRSLSAKASRGFHSACRDIGAARRFVVHAGEDRFPISETAEGIGVKELASTLAEMD